MENSAKKFNIYPQSLSELKLKKLQKEGKMDQIAARMGSEDSEEYLRLLKIFTRTLLYDIAVEDCGLEMDVLIVFPLRHQIIGGYFLLRVLFFVHYRTHTVHTNYFECSKN